MADFKPISPPIHVLDQSGETHTVVGWYSLSGEWFDLQPVVADPDKVGGARPWNYYHGEDPWRLS